MTRQETPLLRALTSLTVDQLEQVVHFEQKIRRLLVLGSETFALPLGIIGRIENHNYTIEHVAGPGICTAGRPRRRGAGEHPVVSRSGTGFAVQSELQTAKYVGYRKAQADFGSGSTEILSLCSAPRPFTFWTKLREFPNVC